MRLLVTCRECLREACAATRPIVSVPRRVNGEASERRTIVGPGLAESRLRAGKVRKEWLFIGVPNKRCVLGQAGTGQVSLEQARLYPFPEALPGLKIPNLVRHLGAVLHSGQAAPQGAAGLGNLTGEEGGKLRRQTKARRPSSPGSHGGKDRRENGLTLLPRVPHLQLGWGRRGGRFPGELRVREAECCQASSAASSALAGGISDPEGTSRVPSPTSRGPRAARTATAPSGHEFGAVSPRGSRGQAQVQVGPQRRQGRSELALQGVRPRESLVSSRRARTGRANSTEHRQPGGKPSPVRRPEEN
ncbi:uncharacterized protein LOC131481628 [Ochotona princeps]|uniref:uncharacterized protein LOC131481628 n=1 Tax=Ochotona princeps TaxID=9978 RepID=UPI002714D05D|nr:uncharacterized protein LOC131481628 [Ochotona princeps]